MSISIPEFWKLLIDSRLLTAGQCQALGAEYGRVKGAAAQGNVKTLVQWLISRNALTKYQAAILQAGRSGPFHYGDYKVYDRVENGRLAGMFRAIHEPTSHAVLLQFVTGPATQDARKWAEIVEHVQRQAKVTHPHLSRCHEPVDLVSFKFVAIEDLRGESLADRVASSGALRVSDACRAVRAAALALHTMHQAKQIHGDVRPHNLWLDAQGHMKLLRDPLFVAMSLHLTPADGANGSQARADYLAPEFSNHDKSPDALTDVYALGCSLYQLLTGRPPFPGGDLTQKLSRHATERIQPLESFGVPPQLAQLVAYMMAKNPAIRYQQADVVAQQIEAFIDPAHLQMQPPGLPRTLPAYEQWIKQKQSALATHSPPPEPSLPRFGEYSAGGASAAVATAPKIDVSSMKSTEGTRVGSAPGSAAAVVPQKSSSTSSVAERLQPKGMTKKQKVMLGAALGGGGGLVLIVLLMFMFFGGGGANDDKQGDPDDGGTNIVQGNGTDNGSPNGGTNVGGNNGKAGNGGNNTGGGTDGSGGGSESFVIPVKDDGNLLWAPPTTGPPISFDAVAKSRLYLIARPADMLENAWGDDALQALGPTFDAARGQWERAAGFLLKDIEQVVIGIHAEEGEPRASFRVRLRTPVTMDDLLKRWNNPTHASQEGAQFYQGGGWAYYVPRVAAGDEDGGVDTFLMGAATEVAQVAKDDGAPPFLMREMRDLLGVSDSHSHLTILFARNDLFNEGGQKLLSGPWKKVVDPLDWFLGQGLQAGMLGMHFDNTFYLEMRMKAEVGKNEYTLASELRDRLSEIPDSVEHYVITEVNPPVYWRGLAMRYPQMIRKMHDYSRVAVEEGQAVINCVLPGNAAPNLLAATELTIFSGPGGGPTVVVKKEETPQNLRELLNVPGKFSYATPRQDLVLAIGEIETAVKSEYPGLPFAFKVGFSNNDLMNDGITKNQPLENFKVEKASLADLLTAVVKRANPDKTVMDVSEPNQKLIWVIAPDPDDAGKEQVLLTTRAGALREKHELPAPFAGK